MSTSKELRERLRKFHNRHCKFPSHKPFFALFAADVLALLDALDTEEKEREKQDVEWVVLRSKSGVEIKAPAPPPGYRWVPLDMDRCANCGLLPSHCECVAVSGLRGPDDEGEGNGPREG